LKPASSTASLRRSTCLSHRRHRQNRQRPSIDEFLPWAYLGQAATVSDLQSGARQAARDRRHQVTDRVAPCRFRGHVKFEERDPICAHRVPSSTCLDPEEPARAIGAAEGEGDAQADCVCGELGREYCFPNRKVRSSRRKRRRPTKPSPTTNNGSSGGNGVGVNVNEPPAPKITPNESPIAYPAAPEDVKYKFISSSPFAIENPKPAKSR
jgi:hypothetical protein